MIVRQREYRRLTGIGDIVRQFDAEAAKALQEEVKRTATPPTPAGSKK